MENEDTVVTTTEATIECSENDGHSGFYKAKTGLDTGIANVGALGCWGAIGGCRSAVKAHCR